VLPGDEKVEAPAPAAEPEAEDDKDAAPEDGVEFEIKEEGDE